LRLDPLTGDGETQARSAVVARAGSVGAPEPVEGMRLLVG
jgi:hypothetical protein